MTARWKPWSPGVLLVLATMPGASSSAEPTADQIAFFEKRVRPVLVQHCHRCHGPEAKKSDLRLDSWAALLKGGSRGPALVPGKPADSLLIKAVRHESAELRMPKVKLPAETIADLEAWVRMGAPGLETRGRAQERTADFWSFRPVVEPALPTVRDSSWSNQAIDRFILAKLEDRGLHPARPADRRTLIRRATFDLTGLPPTPEEVDAFLTDASPQAFARVVDRLLASPAYGERWGRHWLDVVRYADTAGDNSDYPIPQMYRYRNWVIDAFNQDMPYDEFIRQQLAGDLLPAGSEKERHAKLIATGYLANARRFGSYEDTRYPWHLTIEDTIDNLGRTFLGLTINCCRCHDHKFDPLTQEDYYALYGFFSSTRYPWPGIELDKAPHDLVPLAPPEQVSASQGERQARLARHDAEIRRLEGAKAAADRALKEAAGKEQVPKLTQQVEELVRKIKAVRKERETLARTPVPYETAYAVAEGRTEGQKKVGNACIQIKGDPERLGKEVPRRFPMVLGGQVLPPNQQGSGRLELARWIADPRNPLTARVMVNRIWHYHFGTGIVPTPSDFGRQGRAPSHPELLDYLASRFQSDGWSIKRMHRRIMFSRTYQMSSEEDAGNRRLDATNEFLWHFARRRLDAESLRDALLAVSGALDRSPGGPHPFPEQTTWDFTQHKPFKAVYASNRRSVYLMTQRIQRHPFLGLFDGADTNASTARRVTSTTPLQALFLMNDPFVHEQARQLAARLLAERPDLASRIERAYLLLFARPPTADELATAKDYLVRVKDRLTGADAQHRAWESLVRALFLTNEFACVN